MAKEDLSNAKQREVNYDAPSKPIKPFTPFALPRRDFRRFAGNGSPKRRAGFQGPRKREEHLSPDGECRSFPKVSHLLRYVSEGKNYGRIGKVIRESLQTTVWCHKIQTSRPRLRDLRVEKTTTQTCEEWAAGLGGMIVSQYFSRTTGTQRSDG